MTIHRAALTGFSSEAGTYERGRPEYPAELLAWLRDELGANPGARVVDLGAGTGKFTALLVRAGADTTAIEPVDAMRERLGRAVPGALALAGAAESIPLGDGSADAVVCAQAFHWFANERALREIHRVLRPGGRLGLVWNVRDESVDWVAAITAIVAPHEGDAPRFHTGRWRRAFESQRLFAEPRLTELRHRQAGPFEQVIVDRIMSVSFVAALPEPTRRDVEARLRALPDAFPALRAPVIDFPYRTEAYAFARG